ncbi:MAG: type II toxin-antitoxin system HipA family toxin [Bacteroidota bacterium]|nr:type II toxin-antitoxin system HipA family toxin [Bacteroidota bacterium]
MDTLKILLYGRHIGTLVLLPGGYCNFEYTPEFCRSGMQPSPLQMPAVQGRIYSFPQLSRETFSGLPGMIADSLPDRFGQALLDQWLESQGRAAGQANALEKLAYQGRRCMGALEYEPSRDIRMDESSSIEMDRLVETARKALTSKESFKSSFDRDEQAILDILKIGTSAGGQRAKAVIAVNDDTGEIRSGQVEAPEGFSYWIIKFDGFDSDGRTMAPADFCRIEYAFSRCIREAGIEMSECRMLEENGRAHFMTRRFDRRRHPLLSGAAEKIHMQTLCGLAHYDFNMAGAYSYEQAFMVMRRLRLSYPEADEMFRRLVFNMVCMNMDDHTKNISFLMDRNGRWTLSPAYDMGFCYNPGGQWAYAHQMTVAGKRQNITRRDLLAFAEAQGVAGAEATIDRVIAAVRRFPEFAAEAGVKEKEVSRIMGFIEDNINKNYVLSQ